MIPDPSIPILALIAVGVVGLFVAVRSLTMPRSFFKNQERKEELRRILDKNKIEQQDS